MTEQTARERFEVQTAAATRKLEKLHAILATARKDFEADDKNWGRVGDIAYMNEMLSRALGEEE